MAQLVLRWSCRRAPAVINSYFRLNGFIQNHTVSTALVPVTSAGCGGRFYSSERGTGKRHTRLFIVPISNPLVWLRFRAAKFVIQTFFDKEFSLKEFTEGARQAFIHVSCLLSQCQFEALEGLVDKDLIGNLKEKCVDLPLSHKTALFADPDEIRYMTHAHVDLSYDENGRKFVTILMRFWYLTKAHLPEDSMDGPGNFLMIIDGKGEKSETKRLIIAEYEFEREFTQGVTPDWTITRIEHSNLLD